MNNEENQQDGGDLVLGLALLAAFFVLIVAVAFSAFAALTGGLVAFAIVRTFSSHPDVTYKNTYEGAFYGGVLFLGAICGLLWILPKWLMMPLQVLIERLTDAPSYYPRESFSLKATCLNALILLLPGWLCYGLGLSIGLPKVFGGGAGFMRAFWVAIPASTSSCTVPFIFYELMADRMHRAKPEEVWVVLLLLCAVLLVYAMITGILNAFFLRVSSRFFVAGSPSFSQAYATAFLSLLAHLFLSAVIVLYALPENSAAVNFIAAAAQSSDLLAYMKNINIGELTRVAIELLVAQIPGFLVAATIVTGRLKSFFLGWSGYAKAAVVSVGGIALLPAMLASLFAFLF